MYSAGIYKEDFLKLKRIVRHEDVKLAKRLEECNKQLLALKRECEGYRIWDSVSHIYLRLLSLMTEMERYLEECRKEEIRKEVLELYFCVRMFVSIHDKLDENYMIYSQLEEI